MPHGVLRPVANTVSFGTTPLDVTGGAGEPTLISNGGGGGPGGGGGGEGGDGDGDGEGEGDGDGDGDGEGLGAGLGDGDAAGAGSSPPHETSAAPAATDSESVKKSALRFTGRRCSGRAVDPV